MKHFKSIYLLLIFLSISSIILGQPLLGNYTIDATSPAGPTNFQSFNAFATSLNLNGISGDVTATVVSGSGPYTEQVIFNTITGSGPNATVTIEGSGEIVTAVTNTNSRHIIRLTNVQYFTINNLKIVRDTSSTSGFYGIHIFQSGNNITLSNNEVDMTGSTSTLVGGYIASGSETSILAAGDFHNINIVLNKTNTGGYGASVYGLASPLSTNINISGNEFISFNDNGVYLRETDGTIVSGNYFDKLTTNITGWNAIQVAQQLNINAQIFNNEIKVSQTNNGTTTIRGIYLFNGTGHKVYNNVIHDVNLTSGNITGIEIRAAGIAPEIYFNTIDFDNTSASTGNLYGIKEELSNTNSVLRNNLINITQTTSGLKSALVLGSTATVTSAFNSDYNWFWVPGGNIGQRGTTSPTFYSTLNAWQTASGQDLNSINIDPQLLTIPYPIPTNITGNDEGIAVGNITEDFLGATRSTPPDIGAFEFGGCPPNAPTEIFGDSVVCENAANIVYSINPVIGATGYTWTAPPGAVISSGQGSTSVTIDFGNQSGVVSVTANDSCGSSPATTVAITIESQLSAPASINGPAAVCEFETLVTYSADSVAGSISYLWNVPTGTTIISGQGTNNIVVNFGNTAGNISVQAVNSCGTSAATSIPVNLNPLPIVTFTLASDTVCDWDVVTLSGGTPSGGTYSGPGVAGGLFDANVAGAGTHMLTYTYTDANGCTDSATVDIVVEICIGINELSTGEKVIVYPNPFNNSATIEIDKSLQMQSIRLIDETGKVVKIFDAFNNRIVINKGNLDAGIYFIEITSKENILLKKKIVVY